MPFDANADAGWVAPKGLARLHAAAHWKCKKADGRFLDGAGMPFGSEFQFDSCFGLVDQLGVLRKCAWNCDDDYAFGNLNAKLLTASLDVVGVGRQSSGHGRTVLKSASEFMFLAPRPESPVSNCSLR